ncbi:MAG: PPOX class F420-dependent oxidoreductase [Thermodesulfobacteriota bacterium]
MRKMTREEYLGFISEGTRTGKLATINKDGSPHVVPIWFLVDGENLIFSTGLSSVKYKNMERDPRVCISVDEEKDLYSFAKIDGIAIFSNDPESMLHWATRIAARYMGEDKAEEYGKRNSGKDETVVTVKPAKMVAYADVAGW